MQSNKLELAVNAAVQTIQRQRMALVSGGIDAKRPKAWCEYGYPEQVTTQMLLSLYQRGGVAFGAVSKVLRKCWQSDPWVIDGGEENDNKRESKYSKEASKVAKDARLWAAVKEADKRRLVAKYSGLLLHFADNKTWADPVDSTSKMLVKVTPAWSTAIKATDWDNNPQSANYGEPSKWQYTEAGGAKRTVDVHPDRVFILGSYADDAIAFLEPAFNNFISLEKVEGGSGESFLKNASRQLAINFDKEIDLANIAAMYGVSLEELRTRFQEVARDINAGNDTLLVTQGAQTQSLVAQVPDPTPTYSVNLQSISAALDIPAKILVGNQTGERASSEDAEDFADMCQSRRADLSVEIADLFRHLGRCGVLPLPAEISVMWDDLRDAKPSDKAALADKLSTINGRAQDVSQEPFTPDEIRSAAGYMPRGQAPTLRDE